MALIPVLEAQGIAVRFAQRTVLAGCSLAIAAGEACVLTGDNGAGKSTLLRVLAGLARADAGSLRLDGEPLPLAAFPAAARRALQYVAADPYLFSTSVRANLDYGLRAHGVAAQARRQRTEGAIEWARLQPVVDTAPQRLSAGEKQRIAIARAGVLEPRVMLFDEPTANLDQAARGQVVELIGSLCRGGTAVLIAAHDRELIELAGARRLHLCDGRLHAVPNPVPVPEPAADAARG